MSANYRKYVKFDENKNYVFPNGELASKEVLAQKFAGFIATGNCVVETDETETMLFSLQPMSVWKMAFANKLTEQGEEADFGKSDEETLQKFTEIANAPEPQTVSTEERIAAALEFNNILNM